MQKSKSDFSCLCEATNLKPPTAQDPGLGLKRFTASIATDPSN